MKSSVSLRLCFLVTEVSATKVICPFRQINRINPNVKSTPVVRSKELLRVNRIPAPSPTTTGLTMEGKSYTP